MWSVWVRLFIYTIPFCSITRYKTVCKILKIFCKSLVITNVLLLLFLLKSFRHNQIGSTIKIIKLKKYHSSAGYLKSGPVYTKGHLFIYLFCFFFFFFGGWGGGLFFLLHAIILWFQEFSITWHWINELVWLAAGWRTSHCRFVLNRQNM